MTSAQPPDPARTGPDIIEAAINNVVATARAGVPVKLCRIDSHHHTKAGRQVLCTSRGKVPVESKWQERTPDDTMPRIFEWMEQGHPVGLCLDHDLIGLDEDLVGGLERFFGAINEPVPVTMGDIVPYSGKQHLIVRKPDGFDASRLTGTFYLPDGTKIGELIHDRNKQLVAPGCEWISADGKHRDWRVWNQIDTFATLSPAAAEALVPPNKGFGFGSAQGSLSYGETPALKVLPGEPDWQWDQSMEARHVILLGETLRLRGTLDTDPVDVANRAWAWGQVHGLTGVHPGTGREVTYDEVLECAQGAFQNFKPDIKLVVPRIERSEWQQSTPPLTAVPPSLIVPVPDYLQSIPTSVTWIGPLAYLGGVSLISGPPKGGKTTLTAGLLHAREAGVPYLSGDPVPVGPSLLISEEGGVPLRHKITGLVTTEVMDRRAFALAGLGSWKQMLDVLRLWCAANPDSLVIIDTLAVWAGLKDENDAAEVTKRIVDLTVLSQELSCAVVLIHHSRKGGGEHGESIRGSSALLGAVDHSIEMDYENALALGRKVEVRSRMHGPKRMALIFDLATQTYGLDPSQQGVESADPFGDMLTHVPHEGAGDGLSRSDLREVWGVDPRRRIQLLMSAGRLNETFVKQGRALVARYHKVDAVRLDLRASVSEEMAAIFEKEKE